MSRRVPTLILGAAALWTLFLACHVLGFRDAVSVLSGTAPTVGGDDAAVGGVLYVVSWLLAVAVAPILAIAALVQWALLRVSPRS
jgi:uncharacterized paraquat-inducible protein A